MLLACYTPYTFSSEFFGPIGPNWMQTRQALETWLTNEIIDETIPSLSNFFNGPNKYFHKVNALLFQLNDIYAATSYTDFSPRQELLLRAIIENKGLTLQEVKKLSKQKNPENMAKEPLYGKVFIASYEPLSEI